MRALGTMLTAVVATLSAATSGLAQTALEAARRDTACAPEDRAAASAELQRLHDEDQGVRSPGAAGGPDIMRTDEERRIEVGRIFALGCMSTAADFYNAALIYQHGETPEHYMQAYMWAARAGELGHPEANWLVVRAVDRYLMNLGKKQLYGTNLISNVFLDPTEAPQWWCLWPVEESFPAERRAALEADDTISTMAETEMRVAEMNQGALPEFGVSCPVDAEPSPPGSVPGHW